jgi:hypothetical protein
MRDMFQLRRVAESLSAMKEISEKSLYSQVIRGPTKNLPFARWRFLYSFTRVSIAIQFTSHVLPPFVENDCSNSQDSGLMSEMMKRTRTGRDQKVRIKKAEGRRLYLVMSDP